MFELILIPAFIRAMAPSDSYQNGLAKSLLKVAHANMMTDTVIANIPFEDLYSIMRRFVGTFSDLVSSINNLAVKYLRETQPY